MDTIRNIDDLIKAKGYKDVDELKKNLGELDYPVTMAYTEKSLRLQTDADRVPFTKHLPFPFTEDDYEDRLSELMCVTDYALHEGYDYTHSDLFKDLALKYAEKHGIYEYNVNKNYMEYWSLYEEGFYFFRVNLNTEGRLLVCHLEWHKEDEIPVPAFLMDEVTKATKYNYFCG